MSHHSSQTPRRRLAADKTSMFVPFRAEQNNRNKTEQKSAFLEVVLTTFVTFRHFPSVFGKTWPPETSILVPFRVRNGTSVSGLHGSEIGDK